MTKEDAKLDARLKDYKHKNNMKINYLGEVAYISKNGQTIAKGASWRCAVKKAMYLNGDVCMCSIFK